MAYGTESVPKVYKIFGAGNPYVTAAKVLSFSKGLVSIDMPAGPSEVLIIADKKADPAFAAADFLSQAEHCRRFLGGFADQLAGTGRGGRPRGNPPVTPACHG